MSPGKTLAPGTRLGAFEVISLLGQGGMGAVYRVRNRITGDDRALKLILPELAARPEFVDRFVREIRLAMAVEHPNLVRVFEPGMDGDNIFLPMELLEGESLAAHIRREGWLQVDIAIGLLLSIGSALSALHARGILHRDVKPSNIFLAVESGRYTPKLLDLGAGKEVEGSDEATAAGAAIGSPHYMAPEQASGRKDLDARVDQYSFAVLAYQVLTGARPYENDDTGHVLAKVLCGASYRRPRELRPDIPPEVEAAILRGMSREREQRFASVDDFLRALVVRTQPAKAPIALAPTPGVASQAETAQSAPANERSGTIGGASVVTRMEPRPSQTKLWAAVGAGVALCLALAGGVIFVTSSASPPTAAAPAVLEPTRAPLPAATPEGPAPAPPPTAASSPTPPPTATSPAATATSAPTATTPPVPTPPAVTPAGPVAATPPPPSHPRPATHPKPAAAPAEDPCHATPGAPCL